MDRAAVERLLDCAISSGGDFAEVFCEETSGSTLLVTGERVEESAVGRVCGVGIRIFRGLASVYGYTNDLDLAHMLRLTSEIAKTLTGPAVERTALAQRCVVQRNPILLPPEQVDYRKKLELCRRSVRAGLAQDSHVVQMSARYTDQSQNVVIANTEGVYAEDTRVKSRLFLQAFADKGSGVQSSYVGPGAMQGFEFFDHLDVEASAREAARSALVSAGADHCPSGRMPVIISGGFGGLLFHEACGHSLEASSVSKGTSEFSGRVGEQVAAPLVTLVDDGSLPGQWGSLGVDDEGTPTQRNVLIENGVLKGYLVDRLGGRRMNTAPTGSARRQSYRFAPVARMTNTFLEAGATRPEDIVANTSHGLYVKYINAGSVNPATGAFNFSTSEAYLVENGRMTRPVKNATLIGTGSEVLQRVDQVGSDAALGEGFCYAASGALFICAGQPTVRISEMTVGGTE